MIQIPYKLGFCLILTMISSLHSMTTRSTNIPIFPNSCVPKTHICLFILLSYLAGWDCRWNLQSHNAPARLSIGIKDLLRWRLITSLAPPTSWPPMNTAGTAGLHPRLTRACSISLPLGISSSSWTVGFAPKSQRSVLMVWHMQHELLLKITTGFSELILATRSSIEKKDSRCRKLPECRQK